MFTFGQPFSPPGNCRRDGHNGNREDPMKNGKFDHADRKKRLYSISEAATYLGRTDWSIRELIWQGKLPQVKVGRRVHLDIRDLDSFIEANKVTNDL